MKFKNIYNYIKEVTKEIPSLYPEEVEEEFLNAFEIIDTNILNLTNSAFNKFKKIELSLSASTKEHGKVLNEGKRDSVRMSILSNAFNAKFGIKKPKLIEIEKSEKENIINYLLENKDRLKFSETTINKSKTKIHKNINNAIDKVFNRFVLNRLFETSNKVLYKAIMEELKKYIEEDVLKTREFLVNTQKRLSEIDLTFLDKINKKGLSRLEPKGLMKFPDYIYTFSDTPEKYSGEQQLINFLKKANIPTTEKIYIEMKGDLSPRIVSSQTTVNKFFSNINKDLLNKIKSLKFGETIENIKSEDIESIIEAANLNSAFEYPIIYVKPAKNEISIIYLGGKRLDNFNIKKQKKSLSLFVKVLNKENKIKEVKLFSIEFTSTSHKEFFGY